MKTYTINGKTYRELPDPCEGCSPMTDDKFRDMGGVITDDGKLSPKDAVAASLNTLIHELAEQVSGIGIAEFKQVAKEMHSGDLIAYARQRGVSGEIIEEARVRVVEIMADALREGMSWAELVEGIRP